MLSRLELSLSPMCEHSEGCEEPASSRQAANTAARALPGGRVIAETAVDHRPCSGRPRDLSADRIPPSGTTFPKIAELVARLCIMVWKDQEASARSRVGAPTSAAHDHLPRRDLSACPPLARQAIFLGLADVGIDQLDRVSHADRRLRGVDQA